MVNSCNDIVDKEIVDGFCSAIGSTKNNGSIYSLKKLVKGDFQNDGLKIFFFRWPKKCMVARRFGVFLDDDVDKINDSTKSTRPG